MTEISLFEIPEFLKQSEQGKIYLERANLYPIGSEEWIDEMREKFVVSYFAKDDVINDIKDFSNLIDVCNYWSANFCASLFVYYMFKKKECNECLIDKFLYYNNMNFAEFIKFEYKYALEKYKNDDVMTDVINDLTEHGKYTIEETIDGFDGIINFLLSNIEEGLNRQITNEEKSILELFIKLDGFEFRNRDRIDIIYKIPIIPYGDYEIMGENYNDRYSFDSSNIIFINGNSYANFQIYEVNRKILDFQISNYKVIFALRNSISRSKGQFYCNCVGDIYKISGDSDDLLFYHTMHTIDHGTTHGFTNIEGERQINLFLECLNKIIKSIKDNYPRINIPFNINNTILNNKCEIVQDGMGHPIV